MPEGWVEANAIRNYRADFKPYKLQGTGGAFAAFGGAGGIRGGVPELRKSYFGIIVMISIVNLQRK
jgi:hypothetical protein